MAETIQKPEIVRIFEEAAVSSENLAEVLSVFYKSLTSKGIPKTLASQLTIQYLESMFASAKK